jgi:membrane dipeptidase
MPHRLMILTVAALVASAAVDGRQAAPLDRAKALHKQVPLIDGHNDYPWAIREKAAGDLSKFDMRREQSAVMTDLLRLKAGGVGGQFWSVYVPANLQGQRAVTATLEQIDLVHQMMRRYPEALALARTADDVERIFKAGKIASLIGMEGGHSIDGSLGTLRMFHRLGAGYMTLTHSANIPWADSCCQPPEHGGLTTFGEAVVREMNWLGMLVDLSHVSVETMTDALRMTQAPVIFSHSSARAVCDHTRNVPDEVLRLLPANGGVVMVTFVPDFISPQAPAHRTARLAEQERLRAASPEDPEAVKRGMEVWQQAHPAPVATLAQVADHIDHVRKVAGIDHVGLGGDFDGIDTVVAGLEDVSKYPDLTAELLRRGYSDADIKKLLGLNLLRVMRAAEQVAAKLQASREPSIATIEELDGKAAGR